MLILIINIIAKRQEEEYNAVILTGDLMQMPSTICKRDKEKILWAQQQKQGNKLKTEEGWGFLLDSPKWILHLLPDRA